MNNINQSDYKFPKTSGRFIGKLVFKRLVTGKPCLMCYFDTNDNEKVVLSVWQDKDGKYCPANSSCDINMLPITTTLSCEFSVSQKDGKQITKIQSAEIYTKVNNEHYFATQFFLMLIKRAYPRTLVANLKIIKFLAGDTFLLATDNSLKTTYSITKSYGNWLILRSKTGDSKEKDTLVTIDNKSYDVVSKEYK